MMRRRTGLAITLLTASLVACVPHEEQTVRRAEVPSAPPACWVYRPVRPELGLIGSVGIARTLAIGGENRVRQLAKVRALLGLAGYLGVTMTEKRLNELVAADGESVVLASHQVQFVDHYDDWYGYRYEYAMLDAPQVTAKAVRTGCDQRCAPAQCEPAWLCAPMTEDAAGFVGVSFRATSLPAQYRAAVENALAQLRYFYGVEVKTQGWFYTAGDSLGSYRLRLTDVAVADGASDSEQSKRFLVTESCFVGPQLYLHVASPDLPPLPQVAAHNWLHQPNQRGYIGATGSAGNTSAGLLSSQIELAVKRALGELAGGTKTHIEDTLSYRQGKEGKSVVWELRTEGQDTVFGRVMGIYFEPRSDSEVRVHAWVVNDVEPTE